MLLTGLAPNELASPTRLSIAALLLSSSRKLALIFFGACSSLAPRGDVAGIGLSTDGESDIDLGRGPGDGERESGDGERERMSGDSDRGDPNESERPRGPGDGDRDKGSGDGERE